MKIVVINSVVRGSTGHIMLNIAKLLRQGGNEVYTFSGAGKSSSEFGHAYFGFQFENLWHRFISVYSGISGVGSTIGTWFLLKKISKIKPDIIHLHNLHGWFINLPMLFDYIKKNNIAVVWTLHDCWSFTGQCSHFIMEKCEKWRTGCFKCPRYKIYPYTYVDRTEKMYQLKQQWFKGVKNMTLIAPSAWLANLVKQSFLREYPVKVIPNGIDLSIFRPCSSDFRMRYNCTDKKILLGVASPWGYRKGLDVFCDLAMRLDKEKYQVVLVGTDSKVDKSLPDNVISIHRTQNQHELAQIYTAADLFINASREENYPTVNMESLACGTPVLTFDTGGSSEIIDANCGSVVAYGDKNALFNEAKRILHGNLYSHEACLRRAKMFDQDSRIDLYRTLYQKYTSLGKE